MCHTYSMNNSITKSLFSQSLDLCDDYLGLEWTQSTRTSMFDVYRRSNDLDPNLAIYHYGNDRFEVRSMIYTFNGCLTGDSVNLGSLITFMTQKIALKLI